MRRVRAIGHRAALRLIVAATLAGTAPGIVAEPLPAATGPVILTISGDIASSHHAGAADFDRETLRGLGWRSVSTYTPWTQGLQKFEGVPLATVLNRIGARGEKLVAAALNDYKVEIPRDDAERFDVLLALKHNGEWMSVREKGPVWIIYPNSSAPNRTSDLHATRMVWQLRTLTVE